MKSFKIYSSQTGELLSRNILADDEKQAIDRFAKNCGYSDRWDMWSKGRFEYASSCASNPDRLAVWRE